MSIAYIFVNCDIGIEIQIIGKLKELCHEVQGTYGIYDFICKLKYDDMKSFEETLQKIRHLQNITHTTTIHTIPEQA